MGFLINVYGYRPRCVLLVSTGGGGDVATALLYAYIVSAEGARAVVAALPWERYVKDPCPGPIELESLGSAELHDYVALVKPGCIATRCCRVFVPAVCKAADLSLMSIPIYALDGWRGELGVRRGLEEIASIHGCEAALIVDVGGDILARGCEESLWSPLGDSLGLSAAINTSIEPRVLVQGLGADGELGDHELFSILAELASRGALIWCRGITRAEASILEQIIGRIHTEAGRVPLLAFRGYYGRYYIRGGTRSVDVNIFKSCAVMLDARGVYALSLPARLVKGSYSLEEARRRLNDAGIYTELDLEIDIHRFIELGSLSPTSILEVRERGRKSLPKCEHPHNQ